MKLRWTGVSKSEGWHAGVHRKNGETRSGSLKHKKSKGMINEGTSNYYASVRFGQVVCDEVSFFASKDGFPIGTYNSYEEAMESLAWKGRAKPL